jgi:hypothetical protein
MEYAEFNLREKPAMPSSDTALLTLLGIFLDSE